MKTPYTKEGKIGLVTIISLALLYVGINYLKGINLFQPSNHYIVACHEVKGIVISSPVFVEGFKVGLVRSIQYDYDTVDKIDVEISLDDDMKINKGSYVLIENTFLSGAELHLKLNKYTKSYLKPGATIEGRYGGDLMRSVEEDIIPQVNLLIPKIDSILTGLQVLINDPALAQSLSNIRTTTANLAASSQKLNIMLGKDIPVVVDNLKTASGNVNEFSKNLKDLDLKATVRSVNETLNNVENFSKQLNRKDSSLGLLLNDRELYDNLNSTSQSATYLLKDLKENPKRYIHIKIF